MPRNKPLKLPAAGFGQSFGFSPTRGVVASPIGGTPAYDLSNASFDFTIDTVRSRVAGSRAIAATLPTRWLVQPPARGSPGLGISSASRPKSRPLRS